MRERERVSERERERKRNILRLKLLKCLHLIIIFMCKCWLRCHGYSGSFPTFTVNFQPRMASVNAVMRLKMIVLEPYVERFY